MTQKAVLRHDLHYAWIEYLDPRDSKAFSLGMDRMGWKNLVEYLPAEKDPKGELRRKDAAHPLLPIRRIGNALLIRPNVINDNDFTQLVDDALITEYEKNNGPGALFDKVQEWNDFLWEWFQNPGLRLKEGKQGELTTDADATHWADIVVASGHGAGGEVWAGNDLYKLYVVPWGSRQAQPARSNHPKYFIIASCMNVHFATARHYLPFLRRTPPMRGILGYCEAYPGDEIGRRVFQDFTRRLHQGTPILEAWRRSNEAQGLSDRWAAVMHLSCTTDTMKAWIDETLPAPDPQGEVRWYGEMRPTGIEVVPGDPDMELIWSVQDPKSDDPQSTIETNELVSGESGMLSLLPANGHLFQPGDKLTLVFYYFRPRKPGMDLNKLFSIDSTSVASAQLSFETNWNKEDDAGSSTRSNIDAITLRVAEEVPELTIPFTVKKDAHKHFHRYGEYNYGLFWIRAILPERMREAWLYMSGITLAGPTHSPEFP